MKPGKRLNLRRDVMSDLTTDDLRRVPGGNQFAPPTYYRCPTIHVECPSDPVTGCTIIYETRATCVGCTVTGPTDICA